MHRRARRVPRPLAELDAASAGSEALAGEEQRADGRSAAPTAAGGEAIVLRFYADLPEQEVAQVMGVSRGTVKSTTARGLAAPGGSCRRNSEQARRPARAGPAGPGGRLRRAIERSLAAPARGDWRPGRYVAAPRRLASLVALVRAGSGGRRGGSGGRRLAGHLHNPVRPSAR